MKNVLMISAAVLTATTILLTGCKKDEDDPPIVPNPVGPSLPQSSALKLHLNLDGNPNPATGTSTSQTSGNIAWIADRNGAANRALYLEGAPGGAGTGAIVEYFGGTYLYPSSTISVWYKLDLSTPWTGGRALFGYGAALGYFFEMSDNQAWCKFTSSHKLVPDPMNRNFAADDLDPNGDGSTGEVVTFDYLAGGGNPTMPEILGEDEDWHQMVMTYNATTSTKTVYIDGRKMMTKVLSNNAEEWRMTELAFKTLGDNDVPVTGYVDKLVLGYFAAQGTTNPDWAQYGNATNTFKGALDDFRIWNVALTESEVATLYDFEN